jgi:oxygen-independent coproporphyrinogen III oxidase
LVELVGDQVRLSEDALPYARAIAARFDAYRQPQHSRFSNAI